MRIIRKEIFELNDRAKPRFERIGGSDNWILIIDDYWKWPREVAKLFDEIIYTDDDDIRGGSPVYRSLACLPHKRLGVKLSELLLERYEKKQMLRYPWAMDKFYDRYEEIEWDRVVPHVDNHMDRAPYYALVIYMNERRIHGGTQFLKRLDLNPRIDKYDDVHSSYPLTKIKPNDPWTWFRDQWQRYGLIAMKFNRLICYRSNLIHAPYTNGRFYRDSPRKIISGVF